MYSQGPQDAILENIFSKTGTTNKFCVEFGFNSIKLDGGTGSNIANLVINKGFQCVLFDCSFENPDINLFKETLTEENICDVFKKYNVPSVPDYVSIDVDSIDYYLMRGLLREYKPRVLSVEYNSNYPIDVSCTVKKGTVWEHGDNVYGASLKALYDLGKTNGYNLVDVAPRLDLFFSNVILGGLSLAECQQYANIPKHRPASVERLKLVIPI